MPSERWGFWDLTSEAECPSLLTAAGLGNRGTHVEGLPCGKTVRLGQKCEFGVPGQIFFLILPQGSLVGRLIQPLYP